MANNKDVIGVFLDIQAAFETINPGSIKQALMHLHRKHINHAMSLIQRIVDQLVTWGTSMGLTFNPTKTVCLQFTRATDKTRKSLSNKLRINGTEIPLSYKTIYLGVQLDRKLTWNAHFDIVVGKAKRYLCQLIGALSKYWGPQPSLVKWIFTAVVRPRKTYAALVWAHSIHTITKKAKTWSDKQISGNDANIQQGKRTNSRSRNNT